MLGVSRKSWGVMTLNFYLTSYGRMCWCIMAPAGRENTAASHNHVSKLWALFLFLCMSVTLDKGELIGGLSYDPF